ncbi:MAG: energy transducer TonB [Ginsengibacter sp.]
MKENKKYTATDFESYHAGSMPANEMHDLEKAALEDSFLADALEGYALSSSAIKDMQELRERLFEKEKNKSTRPVYSLSRNAWWRIAALFIMIAGAGIIFYKININSKQNVIAKADHKESLRADSNFSLSSADTASSQGIVAFENSSAAKSGENKITPLPETKAKADRKISAPFSLKKESQADMASIEVNRENKKLVDEYVLKGKVTDHEGHPLATASVKAKSKNAITASAPRGNISVVTSDSNNTAIVSAPAYDTKNAVLQKQIESRVAEVQMKSTAPKVSNPKFDEYVKTHIKPVFDENKVRQTGEIKLSFNISKEGKPENIKIKNSSCKACEAQAIELLKNGPLWKNETSTGKIVLIKF